MNGRESLSGGRALAYALAAAVVGMIVAFALPVLAVVFFGPLLQPLSFVWRATVLLVLTDVGFGLAVAGYLALRDLDLSYVRVRVPSLSDVLWGAGGYVAALALAFGGVVLVTLFSVPTAENNVAQVAQRDPTFLLYLIPLAFLFIGPAEELLFRGVVQRTLREAFSPWLAIPVASAIFAGIHVFALSGALGARLVTIAILFFPSLVFGAVYERTGNIVPSAVIHGAYDATLFALFYVSLRYAGGTAAALL